MDLGTREKEIITRALEIAGIEDRTGLKVKAERTAIPETLIPNLSTALPIWRVRVENAPLKFRVEGVMKTNSFVRCFEMDFLEGSETLIRLKTDWPKGAAGTPFPTIESYAAQQTGTEPIFVGEPNTMPKLNLQDALGNSQASVWNAKQVVAFFGPGVLSRNQASVATVTRVGYSCRRNSSFDPFPTTHPQ